MNNRPIILDCEDIKTTLISLENIYEINKEEIISFLTNLNLDKYYETNDLLLQAI